VQFTRLTEPNSTFKQKKTAILLILSWIFRGLMQGGFSAE